MKRLVVVLVIGATLTACSILDSEPDQPKAKIDVSEGRVKNLYVGDSLSTMRELWGQAADSMWIMSTHGDMAFGYKRYKTFVYAAYDTTASQHFVNGFKIYRGKTQKGFEIGSHLEKAKRIYGSFRHVIDYKSKPGGYFITCHNGYELTLLVNEKRKVTALWIGWLKEESYSQRCNLNQ